MTHLLIATGNRGKLGEFAALLNGTPFVVRGLDEFPGVQLPEETGTTYRANAILKAEAACRATGLPTLGDDSGLEVDALGGAPGLYSARYAKERLVGESQDAANRRALLAALTQTGVPPERWTAHFVCVLAYAEPGRQTRCFEGRADGMVLPAPRGDGGFGYDPLLLLPVRGLTFAEIDEAEKNRISHRGQATAAFLAAIRT